MKKLRLFTTPKVLFLIYVLLSTHFVHGQWQLKGLVLDENTGKPIENVNITTLTGLLSKTNEEGHFFLEVNDNCTEVFFKHIGFYVVKAKVCKKNAQQEQVFFLTPRQYQIEKIDIIPPTIEEYIGWFRSQIPKNYPNRKTKTKVLFQEVIKENDSNILFFRALSDANKWPYLQKRNDQISFSTSYLLAHNRNAFLWKYLFFINGPYEMLQSDVARNPDDFLIIPADKKNFLDKSFVKYYRYKVEKNDTAELVISFEPRIGKSVFAGKVIFEAPTMALKCLEYWYDNRMIQLPELTNSQTAEALGAQGVFLSDKSYYSKITYKKHQHVWYLQTAQISYSFEMYDDKTRKTHLIDVSDKLYVLDFEYADWEKFRFRERVKWGMSMLYQQTKPSENKKKEIELLFQQLDFFKEQ